MEWIKSYTMDKSGEKQSAAMLEARIKRLESRLRNKDGIIQDLAFYVTLSEFQKQMLKLRDASYGGREDHYTAWDELIKTHRTDITAESLLQMKAKEVPTEELGEIRTMIRYEKERGINLADIECVIGKYKKSAEKLVR